MTYSLLVLAGDGIGSEIMAQAVRVLNWLSDNRGVQFNLTHDHVGGSAYDVYGTPCADETLEKARNSDAVLLACVGGPKWDSVPFSHKPERGLLRLRKELDLFANLRPALCFNALASNSTLKPEVISGLDIMIVRELVGGVYFGEPRGIDTLANGQRRGYDTQVYETDEVRRIARVAFDLARKRGSKVVSCEKSNVMQSGILWKEEVTTVHQTEGYSDVALSHMYADNAAMQLVRNPKQFDVIVTDNLFGDILSDVAAMLTGSLGMLPSASLGGTNPKTGRPFAMYEPVHGSAPDIAGKGVANPIAMILSVAMMLRYSLDLKSEADLVEAAIAQVLADKIYTPDIATSDVKAVSTQQMGDAILKALDALK